MADCDETYNYWEPLHYILYGYGFQTWEYDPDYALRSFAYLIPYAGLARIIGVLVHTDKRIIFYGIRIVQAASSAISLLFLYDSTVWRFGKAAACLFLAFCLGSPGIFRASVELLPSSWAMICITISTAYWMVGQYPEAVLGVAVATVLGWPFVAVLGLPLFLHSTNRIGLAPLLRIVAMQGIVLVGISLACDSWYYGKSTIAVINHFVYNVFPVENAGPDIFGTEDSTFYIINLLLNVNVAVIGAALYLALWVVDSFIVTIWNNDKTVMVERIVYLSPAYIWLFILGSQPHKEERFMAPIYPLLCLVAAVSIADVVKVLCFPNGAGRPRKSAGRLLLLVIAFLSLGLGVSRSYGQVKHFGAPFDMYTKLAKAELSNIRDRNITICLGKEWYRFPSHFFLSDNKRHRVAFVESGFDGLLPKYFSESSMLGTRDPASGFNPFNKADPAQFLQDPGGRCHYFIDWLPHGSTLPSSRNPVPKQHLSIVAQQPFLDSAKSPRLARAFWIPREGFHTQLRHGLYTIYRHNGLLALAPQADSSQDSEPAPPPVKDEL